MAKRPRVPVTLNRGAKHNGHVCACGSRQHSTCQTRLSAVQQPQGGLRWLSEMGRAMHVSGSEGSRVVNVYTCRLQQHQRRAISSSPLGKVMSMIVMPRRTDQVLPRLEKDARLPGLKSHNGGVLNPTLVASVSYRTGAENANDNAGMLTRKTRTQPSAMSYWYIFQRACVIT